MSANKNFFFIDDSGSRSWDNPYSREFSENPPSRDEENLSYWRRNYFVLAGIHIPRDAVKRLNPLINLEKEKYFGTKHVEIKSDFLRIPQKRTKYYLSRYSIKEEDLRKFVEKFWYRKGP